MVRPRSQSVPLRDRLGDIVEASGELVAIVILLAVVTFVIMRLPKVDEVTHSEAFGADGS